MLDTLAEKQGTMIRFISKGQKGPLRWVGFGHQHSFAPSLFQFEYTSDHIQPVHFFIKLNIWPIRFLINKSQPDFIRFYLNGLK